MMPSIEYGLGISKKADLMGKQHEANPVAAL
ncbi:MAG: hypothetical protein HW422_1490 [Cutibacterium acnes]|jgi:hypothetical protein|nr:hypothetical protein [Cutibacterium acnes]